MQPSISAIIPLHNKESEILHTLDSLITYFKKEKLEYEIIIIENGSTDDSKLIAHNYIKNLDNIFLTECQKGLGKALKLGIKNSSKKVIWFVPADFLFKTSDLSYYLNNNIFPKFGISSRAHPNSIVDRELNRKIISFVYFLIYKTTLSLNLRDLNGAFIGEAKRIKEIANLVNSDNFFFQTELISRYIKKYGDYKEIPVEVYESDTNKTTIKFFRDILLILKDLLSYKFFK